MYNHNHPGYSFTIEEVSPQEIERHKNKKQKRNYTKYVKEPAKEPKPFTFNGIPTY